MVFKIFVTNQYQLMFKKKIPPMNSMSNQMQCDLNPEGHQNCMTGSKVIAILLDGWNSVKLHWEGSAPAVCPAGLIWGIMTQSHLEG